MLLKTFKTRFQEELSSLYDEQEVASFFYLILEKLHGLKRIDLALYPETVMDGSHLKQWKKVLSELKTQKPIQYILGETEFYGLRFEVDEHTLIPRPETEELVALILKSISQDNNENQKTKILDIGTGSGCIAISLAKNTVNSKIFALDVSEKALATAKKNADYHKVDIAFLLQNILETEAFDQHFDIIVSNPPYVRVLEKAEIKPNVLEYEPHLALFVEDNDALLFYRKISELAIKQLSVNGKLYFEINQYLGEQIAALVQAYGFNEVKIHKDVYGNDRMISAIK